MDNNNVKKLLEETSKGNFKTVNDIISKQEITLSTNSATNIVIECCRIFTKKDNSFSINEQQLLNLLTTCTTYIEKLNEKQSLSYIKSLYFIVKYFYETNNPQVMVDMLPIILADVIDYNTEGLTTVYNSIWSLFHNTISKFSASKESREDLYFKICLSALKIYKIHCPNCILVANLAASYCAVSKCYQADPQVQFNFYKAILLVMKESHTEKSNDFYTGTIRVVEFGTKNLFKQRDFVKIHGYLQYYKSFIDELTKTKMFVEIGNVFYSTAQCVVEIQNLSSSELITKFEACFNSTKLYFSSFPKATQVPYICNILSYIFENLFEYYYTVPPATWNACLEEATLGVAFKILSILSQVFTKNNMKCKYCKGACGVDTTLFHSINIKGLIGGLTQKYVSNEINMSIHMSNQVFHSLEQCCTQIVTLKNKKCTIWPTAWAEIAIKIYNIATKLYVAKHSEAPKYFMLLLKTTLKLEGGTSEVFQFDVLQTTLCCLLEIHTEACDYKQAFMFVALMVLLRQNSLELCFKHWIRVKVKERQNEVDSSLQELTIACVIQQNLKQIKDIYPQAEDYLSNSEQLLIEELNCYKKKWPSRIPMLAVFRKIYEQCSLSTTVKALVTTWVTKPISAHSGVFELLPEIIDRFERRIVAASKCKLDDIYLAHLYVLRYHALVTEAREKNFQEIDKVNAQSEMSSFSKDNKYDIISTCTNLKLNENLKVVENLKKALSIFNKSVTSFMEPQVVEVFQECNVLSVIANIAFEFRLHCDLLESTKAWFLCLKISRILENIEIRLKSIGFILENSCLNVTVIKELLKESEDLVDKLQSMDTFEAYEALTTFYTNKSIMFYNNQKFSCGFKCYEKAVCVFNKISVEEQSEIVKSRLNLLYVQYLQLPCDLNINDHDVYTLQTLSQVCKKISMYLQEQGYVSSYGLAVLFEVNCMLIHMYKRMFLPREVRCYSRDLVVLAQRMAIPLRTAIITSYLAFADLQTNRIDSCQVKIDGLSDILCLTTNKHCRIRKNEIVCDKLRWENNDIAELADNFSDILLDCPVTTKEKELQGSPILSKSFKLPSILSHDVECDCFYCLSVEYQNLIITVMYLDAEHYVLMDNTTAANYCFGTALELYNRFTSTSNQFKEKITKLISYYPFFDIKNVLCQSYCTALLGYGKHLFKNNDLLKSKHIYKDLINLISENMYLNLYLYSEAHLDYAIILKNSITVPKLQLNEVETIVIPDDASNCLKTPESKRSKVIFYRSYSPNPESPPKRVVRKIKCDFSEAADKNTITTIKKNKDYVVPGLITPGCSSERYEPRLIQTVKKKPIPIKIPALNNDDGNDTLIVPGSPNAYTPSALKASAGLPSRTRMLTKKLQSEIAKKRIAQSDKDKHGVNQNSDFKTTVCKNLMKELDATDEKCARKKSENKVNSVSVEQTKRVTRGTARKKKLV